MAEGRMFGAWLSGELLRNAERRANDIAGGNESAYLKSLIAHDLDGAAPEPGANILVELARKFHPTIARELDEVLHDDNGAPRLPQSKVLLVALESILTAVKIQRQSEEGVMREESQAQTAKRRMREIEDMFTGATDPFLATKLIERSEGVHPPAARPAAQPERGRGKRRQG